jgi:hypothetical protein
VDVSSARMQDFNVVGLPDNAVKESRERIKSALRNCGFEFPYGQGVTINLAPADVRKEGSGFDLPMALGLAGCMGQFFGKPVDRCMFLGDAGVPEKCAGGNAPAARRRGRNDFPRGDLGNLSFTLHAGGGHESLSVWVISSRLGPGTSSAIFVTP